MDVKITKIWNLGAYNLPKFDENIKKCMLILLITKHAMILPYTTSNVSGYKCIVRM